MARKRMLSPDFFTSKTLNALPIQTCMTFAGIWCWADDFGRGEDDAALVKASVWPRRKTLTEAKVRADMDALIKAEVLCSYAVKGHDLIHVINWSEHQKISHPTPSKLPPCQTHEPDAWLKFESDTDPALTKFRSDSGTTPERIRRVS
jgi:hypothetical protein